jgi:hypothetical protein
MNASELKYQLEARNTETHFFSRENMKFAGDTMRNYGVRSATIRTNYNAAGEYVGKDGGIDMEVWELYRKRPVKHGLQSSAYFDKQTFVQVFPAR